MLLHAFHEGGQVNIEISDDGGGLNVEKIRQKAIQNGVVTAEKAARLSEREIYGLIFLPGFSTAEKVTNVSGRGVGMDVVRTNVEKIGGTVDVHSRAGAGTTVRLKIPLTLAIVPALIVTCAGDRYAIPQVSLLELVHVEPEDAQAAIEDVHGAAVYRLRGNLLPLVFLAKELQVESPRGAAASDLGADSSTDAAGGLSIVVLHADGEQFGLVVDDVNDTQEIVVKPLGNNFRGVAAYSGATIMGDGRVALILDVVGLAQKSGVLASTHDRIREEQEKAPPVAPGRADTLLLLFADPCASRMAIPLARAARLEEVPRSAIENVGGREVMQYRGEIMPRDSHWGCDSRAKKNVPRCEHDRVREQGFASGSRFHVRRPQFGSRRWKAAGHRRRGFWRAESSEPRRCSGLRGDSVKNHGTDRFGICRAARFGRRVGSEISQ